VGSLAVGKGRPEAVRLLHLPAAPFPGRLVLAILPIGAIMLLSKITVQSGVKRHPEDAEAAGRSTLDGDLAQLKTGAP